MRRNTIVRGGSSVAFAMGLVITLAIIATHTLKGWQKGLDSSMTIKLMAWIELAFILGCMWYSKVKGYGWMCGLLGLLGPLGIAVVACLENKAKNPTGQGAARKLRLLHWLFWGMVVLWFAASIFRPENLPAIGKQNIAHFMNDILVDIAFGLLAFYVLKGAKWARVSCYVLSVPLLLLTLVFWQSMLDLGVMAICDVWIAEESFSDSLIDTGDVLGVMGWVCLIIGTTCLLDSKVQEAFAKMKPSSRFGWMWCLIFWALLLSGLL